MFIAGRRVSLAAILISALWIIATFFPALGTCHSGRITWFDNLTVVFFGWLGPFFGMFGWYANLPLCISLIWLYRLKTPNIIVAVLGLGLASTTFAPVRMAHNTLRSEDLCVWGPGFWLWYACFVIVLGLSLWHWCYPVPDKQSEGEVG